MSEQNGVRAWLLPRLSVIAISMIAMSNVSIARDQPIDEIIIQGEKVDRSLQDTASSVGVLTEVQIQESAIYDIQDIFDRLANVNGAQGNEGFTIRGINDNAVGSAGTSGLASFHVDGAFIGRRGIQAGQKELWDVSQVEVFRGPQSTNQGRNSLAGAIFVRSNDPTYEPEGQYRVGFGSDNTRVLSAAYGNALIDDQLAFRVSIDDQASDGFITNELLNDDEYGDSSNTTVRGKLLFEPAAIDGLSVLSTLSHSENQAGDVFSSLIDESGNAIDPFSNRVFANIEGIENVDQLIVTTEVNYALTDQWSFTSISSYNETDFTRQDDDDRQASGGDATRSREEITDTLSQEFRLSFESDRLRSNIGAYYFRADNDEEIQDIIITENLQATIAATLPSLNPALAPLAPTVASFYDDTLVIDRAGIVSQDIENYAIFANVEYIVSDFVTIFGGVRYDSEDVNNFEDISNTSVGDLPDPASFVSIPGTGTFIAAAVSGVNSLINTSASLNNDADFSAFLPKAGITLNWTDNLSTSVTVQRAYRAGGSGTAAVLLSEGTGNFTFDPEFTNNFDLSLRSQWLDNRLTFNANIFYVDWEDQQVDLFVASQDFVTVNAASSELMGLELELSYRPNDVLDLYATFGYVDTEFDDFPTESILLASDDLSGNSFNDAPQTTASAGFAYDIHPSLRLQADINYQEGSFDDAQNTSENDSRAVLNSKISYQLNEALEFALVGRNLLDREYLVRNNEFDRDAVIVGQPRTLLLQMQGKF